VNGAAFVVDGAARLATGLRLLSRELRRAFRRAAHDQLASTVQSRH
jgi:hypothetical protein